MQFGMIGLGRMGLNMTLRAAAGGHSPVAYTRDPKKVAEAAAGGAVGASSLEDLVSKLKAPRVVWLMLPAGAITEDHVTKLAGLLKKGDIIVEGGNSHYKDDIRRHDELSKKGLRYLDAGVSGGIWGLKIGYCTMVGGASEDFARVEPLVKTLAPKDGYLHCGGPGAGHFVKMVHNGVEYGMMQAYGEGFEILKASPFPLDLGRVARLWNQGSVVRSWLLELAEKALSEDPDLAGVQGYVEDSGEGRWTVQQAVDSGVAAPVITISLFQRFLSREKDAFANKVLAALRNQFGGHALAKGGEDKRSAGAGAGGVRPAAADPGKKRA